MGDVVVVKKQCQCGKFVEPGCGTRCYACAAANIEDEIAEMQQNAATRFALNNLRDYAAWLARVQRSGKPVRPYAPRRAVPLLNGDRTMFRQYCMVCSKAFVTLYIGKTPTCKRCREAINHFF